MPSLAWQQGQLSHAQQQVKWMHGCTKADCSQFCMNKVSCMIPEEKAVEMTALGTTLHKPWPFIHF